MKAEYFEFTSYTFDHVEKQATFSYKIVLSDAPDLEFTEKIEFADKINLEGISHDLLTQLFQGVHFMLGVSYFKLYAPKIVKHPYKLTKEQAEHWNTLYTEGLGEFYYVNSLDPHEFKGFEYDENHNVIASALKRKQRALVGIGGGKDSIVSVELLKKRGVDVTAFVKETQKTYDVIESVISVMDIPSLKIRRILDEKIFIKHPDSYNGHVPISGVYAWLGVLCSVLYDYQYVVVSNEYSSSFGNIEYKGFEVNHQWSKAQEYETMIQEYVHSYITPHITYFSLLRSLYEIRIVQLFTEYPQYFDTFTSCNRVFSINNQLKDSLWCGECPKCVFVFTLLSAFLEKGVLVKMFGKNLYEDKELEQLFRDILGIGTMKPFDCVGTFEESQVAFCMAQKEFGDSYIHQTLFSELEITDEMKNNVFGYFNAPKTPAFFKLCTAQSAAIMGYGIEGEALEQYIHTFHPDMRIGILDQKDDQAYLEKQNKYDIALKSPGISKALMTIPYTTSTNIFFSLVKGHAHTIGVTGTKGKSTTASLIHEIFKANKKDSRLLGNIGEPMVKGLLQPYFDNTYFILELSSYQLDDCEYSPECAVAVNIFSDHIPYHGSQETYELAKQNIVKFQYPQDTFICLNDSKVCAWKEDNKIEVDDEGMSDFSHSMIGEHNIKNIQLAYAVSQHYSLADDLTLKGIKEFKPLPHRLEYVGEYEGIHFYDDAISTTPESTIAALNSLDNVKTIMLGGEDRGYDFTQLVKILEEKEVENIILFPDSGKRIKELLSDNINLFETRSMEDAVAWAFENTPQGARCLLSTASPSYSVWKNFKEKGELFQHSVKSHKKG